MRGGDTKSDASLHVKVRGARVEFEVIPPIPPGAEGTEAQQIARLAMNVVAPMGFVPGCMEKVLEALAPFGVSVDGNEATTNKEAKNGGN